MKLNDKFSFKVAVGLGLAILEYTNTIHGLQQISRVLRHVKLSSTENVSQRCTWGLQLFNAYI